MIKGDANMTVGCFQQTTDRDLMISPSLPFLHASLGFAFKMNDEFASPLNRLMAPFSFPLWILIFVFLCVSSIFVLLTKSFSPRTRHFIIGGRLNRTPVFNMIHLVFEGAIGNRVMITQNRYFSTFSRWLTIIWIFAFLIIRNSYQGSLYKCLQGQRLPSPFDTVDKVRQSDCRVNLNPSGVEIVNRTIHPFERYTYTLYNYTPNIDR